MGTSSRHERFRGWIADAAPVAGLRPPQGAAQLWIALGTVTMGTERSGMNDNTSDTGASLPCTCAEAVERVYEFLDGELTPEVDEQIRRHLQVCARCHPAFEYERVFLRFLEQRCVIERASPELRRRIMDALLEEEAARGQG